MSFADLVRDMLLDQQREVDVKKAAEAKAQRAKEQREAKGREADLAAKLQQDEAKLATAAKALRVAENRARTEQINAVAAERAKKKGRAVTGEDRSWAARQVAKVQGQ